MRIQVRSISHEGLRIQKSIQAEDIGLAEEEFNVLSPIHLDIKAEKAGDELCVAVKASGVYAFSCARCLNEISREQQNTFDIYCDIDPATDFVDISEDIRQELVLALTSGVILCKPDCQGICPNCGVNLNDESCRCPEDLKNPVVMRKEGDPEDKPRRLAI